MATPACNNNLVEALPVRSEVEMLVDMALRGTAAGAADLAHMDGAASAINYIRIADLVAGSRPPGELLDWGCGYGQVTWLLKRRGLNIVSCDVEKRPAICAVPELASQSIQYLDHPYLLPYASGRFGAALSVGVLEHVSDFNASLSEIRRVLRPSGLFFVFMLPNRYSWAERLADYRNRSVHPFKFTPSSARKLLEAHGFTLKRLWRRNVLPRNLTGMSQKVKALYGRMYQGVETTDRILCSIPFISLLSGVIEMVAVADSDR